MKRDMDLVRKIVLTMASPDTGWGLGGLDDVDDKTFKYHALLLIDAGLAEANRNGPSNLYAGIKLLRLTWDGHEFASAIQQETLWNKAKEKVIKPATGWTFGILTDYLKAEISQKLLGA